MDAISSVGAMSTTMPQMVAGGAAASLSSTSNAMSTGGAMSAVADMQMSMVQESVSNMLASVGGESMANNDVLKMAIALLILNMMSGQDKTGDSKDMMNALLTGMIARGSGNGGGMTAISMETTTASIAIGQSVSMGYVQQSYSAASVSTGGFSAGA